MSLCPEAAKRAALPDGEFWDRVFGRNYAGPDYEPEIPDHIQMAELHLSDPCPECGEHGACGYDDIGRPMIHATPKDEEDRNE